MRKLAGFSFIIPMEYTKPPLTFDQQINLLESRGVTIQDKEKAKNILRRISYYRLSAYFIPFLNQKDSFKQDVTIEKIERLYNFDHKLRTLVFDGLQIVEVSIRTLITYHLAHRYGTFGYSDFSNFSPSFRNYEKWINNLNEELNRSKELFIEHYKLKYSDSKYYPIWMVTEVISFGALSQLFKGLKPKDQKEISTYFNLTHKVLKSWIHNLVYVRNICAHHARLWNRTLGIKPIIPIKMDTWHNPYTITNNKIFSSLSILYYFMKKINSNYSYFKDQLKLLLNNNQEVDLNAMGMNEKWYKHSIWG